MYNAICEACHWFRHLAARDLDIKGGACREHRKEARACPHIEDPRGVATIIDTDEQDWLGVNESWNEARVGAKRRLYRRDGSSIPPTTPNNSWLERSVGSIPSTTGNSRQLSDRREKPS